jgi:hypothetical protein
MDAQFIVALIQEDGGHGQNGRARISLPSFSQELLFAP